MSIDKGLWHTCKLCGKDITLLAKQYGGNGKYYTQVFKKHLEVDHNYTATEYFSEFDIRPLCACGICKQEVNMGSAGKSSFAWRLFRCGRNPGTLAWSEMAKETRKGENNPMYGQKAWNDGLTKETSTTIQAISDKMTGRTIPDSAKQKMSIAAKKRLVHGHTGILHSKESKQKMREATLRRIKDGHFKQLVSKPHIAMKAILDSMQLSYIEEYIVGYWSFDFRLGSGILIEVDGDYFHSNPKIYPNGPKSNTQKINHCRDMKKDRYCRDNSLLLLRFWESDILSNPDGIKESILCHLKK